MSISQEQKQQKIYHITGNKQVKNT